jgi:hypothetical protein
MCTKCALCTECLEDQTLSTEKCTKCYSFLSVQTQTLKDTFSFLPRVLFLPIVVGIEHMVKYMKHVC